jgi:hypothetical protein
MQQSLEAMEAALRVLTAINEKQNPDVDDVHALRTYAGPQPDSMSLEDFARDVIQKALKQWAEVRDAGSGLG